MPPPPEAAPRAAPRSPWTPTPRKPGQPYKSPACPPLERDRRAILAMAGDYRVTFDFLEVETFPPQTPRDKPYQSWGTEHVYVDSDSGNLISLVHILNMRIVRMTAR